MNHSVIAVYDKKLGIYGAPMLYIDNREAIREFGNVKSDTTTKFGKNPEDFDLHEIASFEATSGTFTQIVPPKQLTSGGH